MSDIKEQVLSYYAVLSSLKDNEAVLNEADWLSFMISMLPVPGLQQVSQIANKIVNDNELNLRFEKIRQEIIQANEKISSLESDIERIGEIAVTVNNEAGLKKLIEEYLAQIIQSVDEDITEFTMDTSNWSFQALINSLIEADLVSISAIRYSQNVLKDSIVKSKKTHMRADDHSSNVVNGTKFSGEKGSVEMRGITQKGHISVENSSIGFHGNSALIFGRPPGALTGNCPICGTTIQVTREQIRGYDAIKCHSCNSVLPFKIE
jgi:hypothetical protein